MPARPTIDNTPALSATVETTTTPYPDVPSSSITKPLMTTLGVPMIDATSTLSAQQSTEIGHIYTDIPTFKMPIPEIYWTLYSTDDTSFTSEYYSTVATATSYTPTLDATYYAVTTSIAIPYATETIIAPLPPTSSHELLNPSLYTPHVISAFISILYFMFHLRQFRKCRSSTVKKTSDSKIATPRRSKSSEIKKGIISSQVVSHHALIVVNVVTAGALARIAYDLGIFGESMSNIEASIEMWKKLEWILSIGTPYIASFVGNLSVRNTKYIARKGPAPVVSYWPTISNYAIAVGFEIAFRASIYLVYVLSGASKGTSIVLTSVVSICSGTTVLALGYRKNRQ